MKPIWGELVNVLGKGATGITMLVRLADGTLAVEKHARSESDLAPCLLRSEERLLWLHQSSPEFIQILDSHLEGESPAILMEYADGGTLREELRQSPARAESDVRRIASTVASGLAKMHSLGHFHRDIKPENLLIVQGEIKIADLGHAHGPPKSCGTLQGAGTPLYSAPEILAGGTSAPRRETRDNRGNAPRRSSWDKQRIPSRHG